MALTVQNLSRGNYVLGGLGAVQGPSAAEAMDLAQREEQRFRDAQRQARQTELSMQETRQAMALRQSQEQRAQQQFEAQQAAARAAAARAAQERAALNTLMEGLGGVGGAPTGAAPAGVIAPTVAPPRVGVTLPTDSYGGGVPLSFGAVTPTVTGGTGTAILPGTGAGDTLGVKRTFAQTPATVPAGQPVRAQYGGIPFDVYPDGRIINTVTNTEIPNTPDFAALREMLTQQTGAGAPPARGAQDLAPRFPAEIAGLSREDFARLPLQDQLDIIQFQDPTAGTRARGAEAYSPYDYRPTGQGFFIETLTPGRAAEIRERNTAMREAGILPPTDQGLLPPTVDAEVTAASGATPPSPEAATAEAPTTAEEAAPTTQPAYGGLQLNFGTPVQLSFGEFDGRGSEAYVGAPERIFQDVELAARQQQRLQLLATYYQQIGNLEGLVGVINQLDELSIEQRYLDGMTAIVGIQQENFAPVQTLLQQRYPGQRVEVRPYTDGTVEIFLDGQSEARLTWDDLATALRSSYDRGFIEQQQALAEEAASRSRFLFEQETEQMLQGAREIAVARNQAEVDRLEGAGSIERIGETASGEVIFQTVINGLPIQFVYREITTRDPATGEDITRLVATPVGRTALER